MQKRECVFFFLLLSLAACGDGERQTESRKSSNEIDAARNFIQAALVGDFDRARLFMINDSLNTEGLNAIERLNERLSKVEREQYQVASIRIHENRRLNDSVHIISYSNSYKNRVDSLRVVKSKGDWLVDFKFIFSKEDSLP